MPGPLGAALARTPLLPAFLALLPAGPASGEPRRLRVRNGCSEPIWIANECRGGVAPDQQNLRLEPGAFHDFRTVDGLASTRYWPKMFCDGDGNRCGLGGSGGPGEACVGPSSDYSQCAPPIDTKFEATFGNEHLPCDPARGQVGGCDHIDISLVDGYTLPFKLEARGKCFDKSNAAVAARVLDCTELSIDGCPAAEKLGDREVDLQAVNARTGQRVGCYSPCTKLIDDKWGNAMAKGKTSRDADVAPFCCPSPAVSAEACRAGPGARTAFVSAVHQTCPGVYGYAYDDDTGLVRCHAQSRYEVTFFCPRPMPAPGAGQEAFRVDSPPRAARAPALAAAAVAPVAPAAPPSALANAPAAAPAAPGGGPAGPPQGGCGVVCDDGVGSASCGYRVQAAALYQFAGQAQACVKAHAFVAAVCPGVCGGCSVEAADCARAAATGLPSEDGSPADVAARRFAALAGPSAGAAAGAATDAAAGAAAAQGAAPGGGRQGGALARVNLPYVVAGVATLAVLAGWAASVAAKVLGWDLPATRAANFQRGPAAPPQSPGGPSGGQAASAAYEGLADCEGPRSAGSGASPAGRKAGLGCL